MKRFLLLLALVGTGLGQAQAHDPCDPQIFNTTTRTCEDAPPLPPPPPPGEGFDVVIGCSQITSTADRLVVLNPNIIDGARGGCAVHGMRWGYASNRCMDHIVNAVGGRTVRSVNYMVCNGENYLRHDVMAESISDIRGLFPNTVQMNLMSINIADPGCRLTGSNGWDNSAAMINRAYNDGIAERAYTLTGSELLQPNQISSDGCHPNNAGVNSQVEVVTNILTTWGVW